jgi:hypothetical protein
LERIGGKRDRVDDFSLLVEGWFVKGGVGKLGREKRKISHRGHRGRALRAQRREEKADPSLRPGNGAGLRSG